MHSKVRKKALIDSICFITDAYPYYDADTRNIFVKRLIRAVADLGISCWVIAPFFPVSKKKTPKKWTDLSPKHRNKIRIFCPRYLSCSNKKIAGFNSVHLTEHFFSEAVMQTVIKENIKPDVFYGHFILPSGLSAAKIGKKLSVPSVFAFGESTLSGIESYGLDAVRALTQEMTAAIAVSSFNQERLIEKALITPERIGVFPNGADETLFYPSNKQKAKESFSLAPSDFAVGYVGAFSARKGMPYLQEIMKKAQNTMVFLCSGKGNLAPHHENCKLCTALSPKDIPRLLCAADVFAFPSENEGCANAVVEALLCGLPVVAWDLPCHRDILNETNALLIPPGDTEGFYQALCTLRDDATLRARLSQGAIESSKNLSLTRRAENITAWLDNMIRKES